MEIVKEIGRLEYQKLEQKGKGLLEGFTQDVSGGGKYKNCLEIIFEQVNDNFIFSEVNLREYDDSLKMKYLYRSGSSKGADITPTAKVTEIDKTFENKIIKSISESLEFKKDNYKSEKKILEGILNVLNKEIVNVKNELKNIINNLPKKEGSCITIVFIKDNEKKYVGDFELFKDKIISDALRKFHYSKTYKKDVYKDIAVCSLCRNKANDIYGLVNTFPFYTIDKPGYISGGFKYEKAWRNYPVCKECAIKLELGKAYLEDNLTFTFYGRKYYLIPKPIYKKNLDSVLKRYQRLKSDDLKDIRKKFSGVEEKIISFLGREENSICFDMMFFEKSNAALNILLNIEDVAPSRFRKIYNTLDDIRETKFFKDKPVNFEILNLIFPKDMYNRYFLDIIDKIISNIKIEYTFIMSFLNDYIVQAFKRYEKEEYLKEHDSFSRAIFRVYGFVYLLEILNLFRKRKEDIKVGLTKSKWDIKDFKSKEEMFEDFFKESEPFFNEDGRKAIFLTGYITKKLLNIQYRRENRKPFISRLKGLKINKKDIIRLLPEIQGKLIEYDSDYYHEEYNLIGRYLINSNNMKNISDQDIPFFFALGMNMTDNFKTNVDDVNKESETLD